MTPEQEESCLQYEPFAGDRDTRVRVLSDRFITTKYRHKCNVCLGEFGPRVRARSRREVYDGRAATFYFCPDCCEAQAKAWEDAGEAIEMRHTIGWQRSRGEFP